tara:strand:+ start:1859 stop:4267 length:2409 start_codon:yes stop_codon:yes gene_type:complete
MARLPYDLSEYATTNIKSYNGASYTASIWWTGTGAGETWTLGSNGISINWETEKVQDKNSPILASKLTMDLMVEDLTQEIFLQNMRTNLQEKDVWVVLETGAGDLLWSGYFILDLESREDVSFPYETTLVAIDGIATLKEVPFLRETNSETGAVPTFPYEKADTFANAGFRRLIGSSTTWIKLLIDNIGMINSGDALVGTILNYTIQTSINWWNEGMNVGPQSQYCPWTQMRINLKDLYETDSENKYRPPTTYDVIKQICINFNCRFYYWRGTFNFVQISEFNTDEQDVSPYANPINIPTREFYFNGGYRLNHDFIGNKNYGAYYQKIESATSGVGLQKLAGSVYQAIPAIKRTNTIYAELAGSNQFNGFPLFLTHNTVTGLDTTWPTDNASHSIRQFSQTGQEFNVMTLTDADTLAGFICRIFVDFTNTSDTDLRFEALWTLRAKPATSTWGAADNYTAYKYTNGNYAQIRWATNQFPLNNNQEYIRQYILVPANSVNSTQTIFDSSTDSITDTSNNLFPTNPAFIGDWDFQFYTFTEYKNNATYPMNATVQGNSTYSHGRIVQNNQLSSGTTGSGTTPIVKAQVPTYYEIDYVDTINNNNDFVSLFVGVQNNAGSFGVSGEQIQNTQAGNDTYTYNVGTLRFGDGSGANTTSTIQVYDGANWQFVDALGKWAKGIYVWNAGTSEYDWSALTYDKKIQEFVGEEIMNNQSKSILTFNGTTVLSETDKFWPSSSRVKFVNPNTKLIDADNKEYMMMRSNFDLVTDQFNGEWVQVKYDNTTQTTGNSTWDGTDFPDNPGETNN